MYNENFLESLTKDVINIFDLKHSRYADNRLNIKMKFVRNYHQNIKIVFTRTWDKCDCGCDREGFDGTATVISSSFEKINIPEIISTLKKAALSKISCSVFSPCIKSIRFTHIEDDDLCTLLINSWNDKSSVFSKLPKDVSFHLISHVIYVSKTHQ